MTQNTQIEALDKIGLEAACREVARRESLNCKTLDAALYHQQVTPGRIEHEVAPVILAYLSALREAPVATGWREIDDEAVSGKRILLLWKPAGGLSEHVELGRFSQSATGWVNTYGKPFSSAPDKWAPLSPFASPAVAPVANTAREDAHVLSVIDREIGNWECGVTAWMVVDKEREDVFAFSWWNLSNELDPEIGHLSDDLLRRIHLDVETRGRKNPEFAVSVHHRNIVLSAVAHALRKRNCSWEDWLEACGWPRGSGTCECYRPGDCDGSCQHPNPGVQS